MHIQKGKYIRRSIYESAPVGPVQFMRDLFCECILQLHSLDVCPWDVFRFVWQRKTVLLSVCSNAYMSVCAEISLRNLKFAHNCAFRPPKGRQISNISLFPNWRGVIIARYCRFRNNVCVRRLLMDVCSGRSRFVVCGIVLIDRMFVFWMCKCNCRMWVRIVYIIT